jgi:hypothetical protein
MSFLSFEKPVGERLPQDAVEQVKYLDALLLDENGRMRLLGADEYRDMPLLHIRIWATLHGRYGIPTKELIAWLKERIGGRKALEIGAGCGDLGFHLGIPMTDSFQQVEDPDTVVYFAINRVRPTLPAPDVDKEDAENAVRRRRPQVVIASYLTEKYDPRKHHTTGNMHGPREDYILERCDTYIFIGNEAVHGKKRLCKVPHETFRYPWLITRSKYTDSNVIYVWENPERRLIQCG